MKYKLNIIITIKGRNNDKPFITWYIIRTQGYSEWNAFKGITGIT